MVDTVADAVREAGANTSMVFVPPRFAAERSSRRPTIGIDLVVCITEGIPVKDMATCTRTWWVAARRSWGRTVRA